MEDLRTAILQYIRIQENVYRYSGQLPPVYNGKGQGQFTSQTHNTGCFLGQLPPVYNGKGCQPQVNSAGVFSSVSGRRVMRPCIFCSGGHYNDQCNEYVSLTDRKKRLTEQGRCFVCLKTGHYLKICPSLKKRCCDHCGKQGYHNRCLCPAKFPEKISNNDNAETFCSTDSNGVTSLPPDSRLSEEVQLKDDHLTYATESLLALGERVLLQTVVVPIFSSDGQTLINARVLLDSASQRTFMTTKLAQQLKLQFCQREHLSVSTFGAEKTREIDTHVVNFKMKAKDGSCLSLSANVLGRITGFIHRSPLLQKDVEFLKLIPQYQLADTIPNVTETTSVDILIGADFFWGIIGSDKVTLPSGMFMLSSKLGYIITGRCHSTDCSASTVHTMFVTFDIDKHLAESCCGLSELCCLSDSSGVSKPSLESLWSQRKMVIAQL